MVAHSRLLLPVPIASLAPKGGPAQAGAVTQPIAEHMRGCGRAAFVLFIATVSSMVR